MLFRAEVRTIARIANVAYRTPREGARPLGSPGRETVVIGDSKASLAPWCATRGEAGRRDTQRSAPRRVLQRDRGGDTRTTARPLPQRS